MKLCSRLVLGRNFCKKWQMWVSESILGKLGVTHDVGWGLVGKPIAYLLFALTGRFWCLCTVPELWGEMCTARLFSQGSTSLHSNFTWTWSSPSTIHSVRKLETLSYPMVKTVSLCVPSFWHNTGVWRTDRQTDGFDVAHTARCKNIPKQIFVGAFFAPLRRHFGMFVHRRQCYSQHHCIHLQQPATIINTWRIIWKNNIIIKTVTSTTL